MGLVRQIDDHCGRPLGYLEKRTLLDVHSYECRAHMLRTDRWKYILHERFRPQLFDMENDPDEVVDLDAGPFYEHVRQHLHERLFTWFRRRNRTEMEESFLFEMGPERDERLGIIIGRWQPSGRNAMPVMISFSL